VFFDYRTGLCDDSYPSRGTAGGGVLYFAACYWSMGEESQAGLG